MRWGFLTYRTVVLLFYSLYLDRIAERVEKAITGDVIECKRPPSQILKRMLVVAIITILGTFLMLMIELGANLVPLIGGLVALALIIPCEMFLTGIGFVDPYFDRAGLSGMESFRVMRRRFFTIAVFSASRRPHFADPDIRLDSRPDLFRCGRRHPRDEYSKGKRGSFTRNKISERRRPSTEFVIQGNRPSVTSS